jgi:hypothetical protein
MNENKMQYPEIPANTKTVIHTISILPFPAIVCAVILFGTGDYSLSLIAAIAVNFLVFVALVAFFYYLAGGFDWKPEKLSIIRGLLFFVLSGLIYGLIFYGYWYLVRLVVAKTSNLPFSDVKGKLLTRESADDRLKKLKALMDGGLISAQEYEAKKAQILSQV